jgi:hypothetical protein
VARRFVSFLLSLLPTYFMVTLWQMTLLRKCLYTMEYEKKYIYRLRCCFSKKMLWCFDTTIKLKDFLQFLKILMIGELWQNCERFIWIVRSFIVLADKFKNKVWLFFNFHWTQFLTIFNYFSHRFSFTFKSWIHFLPLLTIHQTTF